MNLLAGTLYDPAVAVSEATTALLAMTALDTTNLRLTFTAPPSGRVFVRIRGGCIHGATTFPQILVGCIESSPNAGTVRGRMPPQGGGFNGTALATTQHPVAVEYVVAGLTPGQVYVWDAAYGVEVVLASTGWKYGGPNNTTGNDAFGGISFEVWDPSPIYTPNAGAAPATTIDGRLPAALVSGRIDASAGAMAANVITAAALAADAGAELADAVWDEPIAGHLTAGTTGAQLNAAGAGGDPWATLLPGAYGAGTAGKIIGDNINATISSRSSHAAADIWSVATRTLSSGANIVLAKGTGITGFNDLDAPGVRGAVGLASANLDTQLDALPTAAEIRVELDTNGADLDAIGGLVTSINSKVDVAVSTRLASAGYTAPDNAGVTSIKAKTDNLPAAPASETTLAAVKAKTDGLNFTVAGKLDVNVLVINGVTLAGAGTGADPMRPA